MATQDVSPFEHQAQRTQHTSTILDNQVMPTVDDTALVPIQTIEADETVRNFPPFLKAQIDDYLQRPGASPSALTCAGINFDLYLTTKQEPARFVECGTNNIMDCGLYQYGSFKKARILVVQPRIGSTFNNGNPAIIMFACGMGRLPMKRGRKIASRWAIWTPTGIKKDIFVERMIINDGDVSSDDDHIITPVPKRLRKNTTAIRSRIIWSPLTPEVTHEQPVQEPIISMEENNMVAIKNEDTNLDTGNRVAISDGAHHPPSYVMSPTETTPIIIDDSETTDDGHTSTLAATSRQHACKLENVLPSLSYTMRASSANMSVSDLTTTTATSARQNSIVSSLSQRSSTTDQKEVVIAFKPTHNSQVYMTIKLAQCNSVQKLFAYARRAKISDSEYFLLCGAIGDKSIEIVRDDNDHFSELMRIVNDEKLKGQEGQTITVTIMPVTY